MSWLIKRGKSAKSTKIRLPRRQDLPDSAFITVDELEEMYGDGNLDYALPIIAISYCWLSPGNPDPDGDLLQAVVKTLTRERAKYASFGFKEMGVFWDWCSLHQRDPLLWRSFMLRPDNALAPEQIKQRDEYLHSRSEEETDSIRWALKQTMDLWYAHRGTTVYMITSLPGRYARARPSYDDSGWTTYERCCAELIKEYTLDYAGWRLVLELDPFTSAVGAPRRSRSVKETSRRWPVGPDDFERLLQDKTFTNGADRRDVTELYRKLSSELLNGALTLDYAAMPKPSTVDGGRLGRCLNFCHNLEIIDLNSVQMGDDCSAELFNALERGALPKLKEMSLNNNEINHRGMEALANAFRRGALATLADVQRKVLAGEIQQGGSINLITSGLQLGENLGSAAPVWAIIQSQGKEKEAANIQDP